MLGDERLKVHHFMKRECVCKKCLTWTFVHYFIPEDNEKQDKLNVFVLYKNYNDVRIKDIEENFPLPGKYKFRFKFEFMNKNVWIDFNNPNTVLPLFEGKIIMKVTRINWGEESKPSNPPQSSSVFPENFTI